MLPASSCPLTTSQRSSYQPVVFRRTGVVQCELARPAPGGRSRRSSDQFCRPNPWAQARCWFRSVKGRADSTARLAFEGGGAALPPTDNLRRGGGGGDGDEDSGTDAGQLQAGAKADDLPKDIQEALAQGKVSDKILKRWSQYSKIPIIGFLCRICPPFRDRILGNPRFLLVLAIELLVGGSAKLTSEKQYRKANFSKEMNMVASDMALEIIADVSVVWLLSTKANFKPQAKGKLARAFAALPAHAFQVGDFTLAQRASNVLLRAAQFMAVGFGSSVVGHTLTSRMVEEQRKHTPRGEEKPEELAPVLPTSLGWGSFMALSANSRYQLINGIEDRLLESAVQNPLFKTLASLGIRFTNTYTGGLQWMWYASKIGLQ